MLGLLLAALFLLGGCKVDLYTRLTEAEANEMVAVLARHGIAADRQPEKGRTMTVRVDRARFADAVDVLRAHGLPRPSFASLGDVFRADGLISSPLEERARLIHALNQELSRTISEIDGVLSARVHIVLPETDALRQNLSPSSASVFIRHDSEIPFGPLTSQIKALIAGSVAGMEYDRVSVVLIPAQRPPLPTSAPTLGGGSAAPAASLAPIRGLELPNLQAPALLVACGLLMAALIALFAVRRLGAERRSLVLSDERR